jgi:hypothetical protein
MREVDSSIVRGLQEELTARKEYGLLTVQQETDIRRQLADAAEAAEKLALEDRLQKLRAALAENVITQQQFYAVSAQLAAQSEAKITGITRQGLSQREKFQQMSHLKQAETIFGILADVTAGVSSSNRTMFEINKVAAIANAIMNTAEGITKALSYGPFVGIPLAAIIAAAGAAQIAQIRSTSFGGGTTPSLAGTTGQVSGQPVGLGQGAAVPLTDQGPRKSTQVINLYVQGNVIGEAGRVELGRYLVNLLNDYTDRTDDQLVIHA